MTAAGTDGRAALFAPGFLEREFLAGSELPERLTLHLLLHLMLGHPRSRRGRDKVLWDTACDLAVLLVRHALLPQEREAPDAFSARCKLQVKKAGRAEEIYALLQAEPELLTPDERLSAVPAAAAAGKACHRKRDRRRGLLDQAGYARKRAVCRRAARAVRDAREPPCVR